MSSHRRGPWSQGEDAYLVQLVHTQGALNWVRIAQLIGSRSPKQCRERYHQNLKPSLNHEPISPEEGLQIERMVSEMGKRWAEIARRLHGRSDNAVKNWWNGSMNRRRRLVMRRRTSTHHHHPSSFDERAQSLSFARPAANRPIDISSPDFSRRAHDRSLPSPAVSEASRAESVDGAPSLVSDHSSRFSISPRLAKSPSIELPPLNSSFRDARRPSLPGIPFRSNYNTSEAEPTYPAPRYEQPKSYGSNQTPMYYRHEPQPLQQHQPPRPQQMHALHLQSPRDLNSYPETKAQLLTAPPTPVQLPPLLFNARQEPALTGPRDSRMHLSSLLG